MNKISLFLTITMLAATTAFAAEGTVKSVSNDKISVEMSDMTKLKKGASVKVNGKLGNITDIEGKAITIRTSKPSELKAGETVKVDKVNTMQGC